MEITINQPVRQSTIRCVLKAAQVGVAVQVKAGKLLTVCLTVHEEKFKKHNS